MLKKCGCCVAFTALLCPCCIFCGSLQLDPQGNLFNIYQDENKQRRITPVGNISQMKKFKVREV
jgi:hypothetical protein